MQASGAAAVDGKLTGETMMFELWVSVALLGLWSCVGVIYNNSRKASKQMDEAVKLLAEIAAKG